MELNGVCSGQSEATNSPSPVLQNIFETASPPQASPQQTQHTRNESMGDIMDISSSSSDEGEVTDSSHRISPDRQTTFDDTAAQHDYEPGLEIGALPIEPSGVYISNASADPRMHSSGPDSTLNSSQNTAANDSLAIANSQEVMVNYSRTNDLSRPHITPLHDEEDSDYEPPEPDSPVDDRAVPVESEMLNSQLSAPFHTSALHNQAVESASASLTRKHSDGRDPLGKSIEDTVDEVISFSKAY